MTQLYEHQKKAVGHILGNKGSGVQNIIEETMIKLTLSKFGKYAVLNVI